MAQCELGRLLDAVHFSAVKHSRQRRKDAEKTPYINHPIGVAHILSSEGNVTDLATLQVSGRGYLCACSLYDNKS